MHIVFVTPEYPTKCQPEGGLGNYVRKVSKELTERGHSVTVFVLSNLIDEWKDGNIYIIQVKKCSIYWRLKRINKFSKWLKIYETWSNSLRIKREVIKRHKRNPFSILQAPNYQALSLTLKTNNKIPVVCRCSSYNPICNAVEGLKRDFIDYIYDWLETQVVIKSDGAFSPSDFIAKVYEHIEGVKLMVIRTPLELPTNYLFESSIPKELKEKKYLLFFGAFSRIKGADLIVQILPKLLNMHHDLYFVFIGKPLPSYDFFNDISTIQQLSPDFEKRIIYFPTLIKEKLFPVIANSFGVILPSRVDNYPNACLEAFSLGVPVVGTYSSSLDEIIIDGLTGYLANNGNSESLYNAVNRLLSQSHEEREEMCKNIHMKVKEIMEEDRVGNLINFYQKVISEYSKIK